MLAECTENTGILVSRMLLHGIGDIHTVTAKLKLSTHFFVGTDVELSHMDVLYNLFVKADSIVNFLLGRTVDVVVSLHTNTVDGHTGSLHLLHHLKDALALHGVALVVVVIEQQGFGICLTGKFESLGNELIAKELVHRALTVGVLCLYIVGDGFVDYIPAVNDVLVAVDDSMDMLSHAGIEHFLRGIVFIHPLTNL